MRVYQYGCQPPTHNEKLVHENMRAAHKYRNVLVEIERGRRAAVRVILGQRVHELELGAEKAKTALDDAIKVVMRARAKSRSRSDTDTQRADIKLAREANKRARQALAMARKAAREEPDTVRALDEIQLRAAELRRGARALCGTYWGTYLLIEDADQASQKSPLYDGTEPNDPRFRRWSGEGAVGVQCQGGLSVRELYAGKDTRIQLHHAPDPDRRGKQTPHYLLRMRVSSDESGGPVRSTASPLPTSPGNTASSFSRSSTCAASPGPEGRRVRTTTTRPRDATGNWLR